MNAETLNAKTRTGGEALVEALKIHGSTHAFCVPGKSYLAALDALYGARDTIRLITCRQEGGAANMAEAYGKLTGKPGICFVTRGPGATNASIGVHTAFQDSTPMILFIGQAAQSHLDREAFQEVDFKAMFAPLAKWAAEIREADRIPEYVARAFHTATSGRPGPVVLSLPEDVLAAPCHTPPTRPYQKHRAAGLARSRAPRACDADARRRAAARAGRSRLDERGDRRHPQICRERSIFPS